MKKLRAVLGCDLKSLAAFRIGLSVILLFDLIGRVSNLEAHYSDNGVLPRELLHQSADSLVLSLHVLGGSVAFEALLFVLAGLAAALLMLGWNTRWMAIMSWVFLASLHARNPMILNPGDSLLLMLAFFGMFLPIGAQYSMDSALDPVAVSDNQHISLATVLLLSLSMLMFFLAVRSIVVAEPGPVSLLPVFKALLYLGLVSPLIGFLPMLHLPARLLFIVIWIAILIATAIFLEWNLFGWTAAVALLAFLPSALWDWMGARTELVRHGGLWINFDKDCSFCRKICLLFRTFLILRKTTVQAAQETPKVYEVMVDYDSWVVYDYDGQVYVRWHAVLLLLRRSPIAWPIGYLLTALGMGRWGDFLYGLIASARSGLSQLTKVLLPDRNYSVANHAIANVLLILYLLVFVSFSISRELSWNMTGMSMLRHALPLEAVWRPQGEAEPALLESIRLTYLTADGTKQTVTFPNFFNVGTDKSTLNTRFLHSQRWRSYLSRVFDSYDPRYEEQLARWVCADRNPGQSIAGVEMRRDRSIDDRSQIPGEKDIRLNCKRT